MALPDLNDALTEAQGKPKDNDPVEDVPPSTVITIDVSDDRGRNYRGSFAYSVPTIGQQVEIGRMKTQYLPQGSPADANAAIIVDVLCYLTVTIAFSDERPKPPWWDPLRGYAMEPYTALYGRCLEYEARFHGRGQDRRADDGDVREPGGREGADPVRVEREVPPPPKRRETLAGDGA